MALFEDRCKAYGMLYKPDECFAFINEFPERQMSLF